MFRFVDNVARITWNHTDNWSHR